MHDDWFLTLTGFREATYEQTAAKLQVRDGCLHSATTSRGYRMGMLETPSLQQLRERGRSSLAALSGPLKVTPVRADVRDLLQNSRNAGALFQVASQFNLLEMTSPGVTPEMGVTRYSQDHTQGPACAIACGAATIYRNYLVPIRGARGQTSHRQIDCLADLGSALGNASGKLWRMRNGYALCSAEGLDLITERLSRLSVEDRDALKQKLQIGIHSDAEVTTGSSPGHVVTQAFCSALPVAYSTLEAQLWEPFARLVLEAAYEATLWAGVMNAAQQGNRRVYLTLLGGGAFGNRTSWIVDAIKHSLDCLSHAALDVQIVSYGAAPPELERLAR